MSNGINYILTIYSHRKVILNYNNISQFYCFYSIFAALVSRRAFTVDMCLSGSEW